MSYLIGGPGGGLAGGLGGVDSTVLAVQSALNVRGAAPLLKADGVMGSKTEAAIQAYRARAGVGFGTKIDAALLSSLGVSAMSMDAETITSGPGGSSIAAASMAGGGSALVVVGLGLVALWYMTKK